MSELRSEVPSEAGGTVAVVDDSDGSVQPPEVGVWFINDDPEYDAFECDACGWQLWRSSRAPLKLLSDTRRTECGGCGSEWAFLLGIVGPDGQARLVTADDVERLSA